MKPSTIKKHLRQLRVLIENTDDPILKSIAYEMETAVRRVTEKTAGWKSLHDQAIDAAQFLRKELNIK